VLTDSQRGASEALDTSLVVSLSTHERLVLPPSLKLRRTAVDEARRLVDGLRTRVCNDRVRSTVLSLCSPQIPQALQPHGFEIKDERRRERVREPRAELCVCDAEDTP
jgi:hypothetical protein